MHYQDEEVYVSVRSRPQNISLVSPTDLLHELPLLPGLCLVAQKEDCYSPVSLTHTLLLDCVLPRILPPRDLFSADIVTTVCLYGDRFLYDQKKNHGRSAVMQTEGADKIRESVHTS